MGSYVLYGQLAKHRPAGPSLPLFVMTVVIFGGLVGMALHQLLTFLPFRTTYAEYPLAVVVASYHMLIRQGRRKLR